jgi:hypothetical protein
MHADRRLHPRVACDIAGEIHCQGKRFPVQVINLSLGGFLVEGEGDLTGLSAPVDRGALELELRFALDGVDIEAECRVVYKRRLSINRVALGLNILALSDQAVTEIDAYVGRHLSY